MSGGLWIAAWLFTIRSLKFSFWQAVLAIVIWPYYLGAAFQFARAVLAVVNVHRLLPIRDYPRPLDL